MDKVSQSQFRKICDRHSLRRDRFNNIINMHGIETYNFNTNSRVL